MNTVDRVWDKARTFWRDERGQTFVEYSLIVALVAVVIIAVFMLLRPAITDLYNRIAEQLSAQ